MQKTAVLALLFLLILPFSVSADSQYTATEIQLSVGSFLLDIDDSTATTDQIDFNGGEFTVTLSGGQFIKIGSADRVNFVYSPTNYSTYVSISCSGSRSTITIQTPSGMPGTIAITITPQGTCSVDGGGGGGGTGGGALTAPLVTPPAPVPPPPDGIPPEEIPPTDFPLTFPIPGSILVPPVVPPVVPIPPVQIPPILPAPIVETIQETVEAIQEVSKGIVEITQSITQGDVPGARIILEDLRANETVTGVIQKILNPILAFVGAIGAILLALTALQASATLAIGFSSLLQFLDISRFLSLGLLYFKKRKPWGRVLEKLTGKPVPAALVQIYEAKFKKIKDSQLTDKEGRFGSIMGPGEYFIKVTKDGFYEKETAIITVDKPDQVINLEIIITPLDQEFSLDYIKRVSLLDLIKRLLDKLSPALLILGTLLSIIALIILPTKLNYIIFSIYILLDILKIYFALHFVKSFGKVLDAATLSNLSLAVVRIFDEDKHILLSTKATDDGGRFNFLIVPGKYYITCVKAGYQPHRSNSIVYTKAALETHDIKLQKTNGAPIPPSPIPTPTPAQPPAPAIPATFLQTPPQVPNGTTPPQPPIMPNI